MREASSEAGFGCGSRYCGIESHGSNCIFSIQTVKIGDIQGLIMMKKFETITETLISFIL